MNPCLSAAAVFRSVRMKESGYALLGSRKIGGGKREYIFAHRRSYEEAFGQIPEGMHIHHTCQNKSCVNPEHLVAMTPAQHKQAHRDSHCQRGHEMTTANTLPRGGCRTCKAIAQKAMVLSPEAKARKAERDLIRWADPEVRRRKAEKDRIRHARNRARVLAGGEMPKL